MKKIILYLVVSCSFLLSSSPAQEHLRYKDVYEVVQTKSPEVAYPMLLSFQRQSPYHVNVYYQLGLIAEKWAKQYDPLLDYPNVKYFTYHTDLYFNLAKSKLDNKEVRKNREYYQQAEKSEGNKKLEYEDVLKHIETKIAKNEEFVENWQKIVDYYYATIDHYNACIENFMEINQSNNKIKNLYLTADKDFRARLLALKTSYDSTIFYFDSYREALNAYPIGDYNQNYEIRPIETYRLEGLTASDFMRDKVKLWNFGQWVEDVSQVLDKDIAQLRDLIAQTHQKAHNEIQTLSASKQFTDSVKYLTIPQTTFFRIEKYDNKSIISSLLSFLQMQQNLLAQTKDSLNYTKKGFRQTELRERAKFYREILQKKQQADTLLEKLSQRINPLNIRKHQVFFERNYKGEDGLKNFIAQQKRENQAVQNRSFENYKFFLYHTLHPNFDTKATIAYKNESLDLFVSEPDFASEKTYTTTQIVREDNGVLFLTGYYNSSGSTRPFVAKIDQQQEVVWLKTFLISRAQPATGLLLDLSENNCHMLASIGKDGAGERKNALIVVSKENGRKIAQEEIDLSQLMPRFFSYDEINSTYLMAFKGKNFSPYTQGIDGLSIYRTNEKLEPVWTQTLSFEGNIVDIVPMNENYVVFGNYTRYSPASGETQKTGNSYPQTATFSVLLDKNQGVVQKENFYSATPKPVMALKAVKINSETVNLIGLQSPSKNRFEKPKVWKEKLFYMLCNAKGELIFSEP